MLNMMQHAADNLWHISLSSEEEKRLKKLRSDLHSRLRQGYEIPQLAKFRDEIADALQFHTVDTEPQGICSKCGTKYESHFNRGAHCLYATKQVMTCRDCGHGWTVYGDVPKQCPNCHHSNLGRNLKQCDGTVL